MKPILHIKLPNALTYEELLRIDKEVKHQTNNEYNILVTYGLELQVLNGEQLTELTFEQFKKQYII